MKLAVCPRYLPGDSIMRYLLSAVALLAVCLTALIAADPPADTPKAAKTRTLLKQKVSFNWKATSFGDVRDEIKDAVKGLGIIVDTKSGVNLNKPITYQCKDKPLEEVLEDLLGKNGWGFFIRSRQNDGYDGTLFIKVGKERGWEGVEGRPGEKKDEKKDK
jgi:hypothetical protein